PRHPEQSVQSAIHRAADAGVLSGAATLVALHDKLQPRHDEKHIADQRCGFSQHVAPSIRCQLLTAIKVGNECNDRRLDEPFFKQQYYEHLQPVLHGKDSIYGWSTSASRSWKVCYDSPDHRWPEQREALRDSV